MLSRVTEGAAIAFAGAAVSKREIARCTYENQVEGLLEAEKILTRLYKSFVEVAKKDESGQIMSNTQPVYAGITYGKYSLTENCMELDSQRGFFV